MKKNFESQFAIGELLYFRPMYRQQQELGISPENLEGQVCAVRFTEAKVFYDLYNNYYGHLFRDVDSCNLSKPKALAEVPSQN